MLKRFFIMDLSAFSVPFPSHHPESAKSISILLFLRIGLIVLSTPKSCAACLTSTKRISSCKLTSGETGIDT